MEGERIWSWKPFNWDDLNRMTAQSGQSGAYYSTYGYDGFGRRVYASGVLTRGPTFYIFDGSQLIGEISQPWGGNQFGQTVVNTWGPTRLVSENITYGPPEPYQANISLWYAYGPQGETRQLTNSAGSVVDTYVYSAYGVLVRPPAVTTTPSVMAANADITPILEAATASSSAAPAGTARHWEGG